jgi:hypothetical protein
MEEFCLETQRMMIRSFTPEDAADLHEILGDDDTMEYCEPAYDFEKTKEFLHSFCIGRKGAVAAFHKESGKMVGYILFNELEKGVYEMGWFFNRRFWGAGPGIRVLQGCDRSCLLGKESPQGVCRNHRHREVRRLDEEAGNAARRHPAEPDQGQPRQLGRFLWFVGRGLEK